MNKITALMATNWTKFTHACSEIQQFQQRIWIVSIQQNLQSQSSLLNDTFVVSEDSFDTPMQWMEKRGYQAAMIQAVDKMQRSQTLNIELAHSQHSLIRVK
ncbi:hypothetical protein [Psychromonas sp.]|uniref:hypothetical protein n=1 Tax=Psychromonas sp. TaxID=1884585 RepID=UPI0039E29617